MPDLSRLIERHPDLAPSRLALVSTGITPAGYRALLESRLVSRLEVLNLQDNLLGPEGARLIAASTRLGFREGARSGSQSPTRDLALSPCPEREA